MVKSSTPYVPQPYRPSPEQEQAAQQARQSRWDTPPPGGWPQAVHPPDQPYTVLVSGGTEFRDAAYLCQVMNALDPKPELIIHGAARGADTLAGSWARLRGVPVIEYPADWRPGGVFNPRAGMIRNQQMIDEGVPHLVIGFPGGTGTEATLKFAKRAGIETKTIPWPYPDRPAPTR